MTNYKRGMVVLVLFPNADLVTAKRRPALVVQADGLNTELNQGCNSHDNKQSFPRRAPKPCSS